jgi:hypothetical protein
VSTGRLLSKGAVLKWSSMLLAPCRNSVMTSKPYCRGGGGGGGLSAAAAGRGAGLSLGARTRTQIRQRQAGRQAGGQAGSRGPPPCAPPAGSGAAFRRRSRPSSGRRPAAWQGGAGLRAESSGWEGWQRGCPPSSWRRRRLPACRGAAPPPPQAHCQQVCLVAQRCTATRYILPCCPPSTCRPGSGRCRCCCTAAAASLSLASGLASPAAPLLLTQSQKPKAFSGLMPNSLTSLRLVDTATMCFGMASSPAAGAGRVAR